MLRHAKTIHKVLLEARALLPLPFFTFRGLSIIFSISTAFAGGISSGEVITLANESRAIAGLNILVENKELSLAATEKANDMIKNDYFAHTSPKGVDPWHWLKNAGYNYKYAGENLAVNYTNAKDQDTAWMNSTTHRANILNSRYRDIGVAVVEGKIDGKDTIVTVELFGSPLPVVSGDQITTVPPVEQKMAQAVGAPFVKGVETTAVTSMNENFLMRKMSLLDFSTLLCIILIALSVFGAPFVLIIKVYGSAWVAFFEEREHAAVMA